MKSKINSTFFTPNGSTPISINTELPNKCPICSTAYGEKPIEICQIEDKYNVRRAFSIYFCPHCQNCFYVTYHVSHARGDCEGRIQNIYPAALAKTNFNKSLSLLSPDFVDIYHQAEIAESNNLTAICGLGYRKSLEFLIKDFSIMLHPDKEEVIKSATLSNCIQPYIPNERIKTLAKASTWLGNDETHYVRKHPDYDLSDLKAFINATVAFINSELTFIEAEKLISNPK